MSAANLPGDGEVDAGFDSGDVGPISGPTKVCRWLRALAAEWEGGSSCYSKRPQTHCRGLIGIPFGSPGLYSNEPSNPGEQDVIITPLAFTGPTTNGAPGYIVLTPALWWA